MNYTASEIISVGTELLLGDIINTDAAFLARELAALGIPCYYQSVVGEIPHVSVQPWSTPSPAPI